MPSCSADVAEVAVVAASAVVVVSVEAVAVSADLVAGVPVVAEQAGVGSPQGEHHGS